MNITLIEHKYENKVFAQGQFKQFALKLTRFCNLSSYDLFIYIHRKIDGFETTAISSTVDDLMNICEIGKTISCLAFHSRSSIIKFSLSYSKALNISYAVNGDMENAKKIIFLTENTMSLTRLSEQGTGDLTLDNIQSTGKTQMDANQSEERTNKQLFLKIDEQ